MRKQRRRETGLWLASGWVCNWRDLVLSKEVSKQWEEEQGGVVRMLIDEGRNGMRPGGKQRRGGYKWGVVDRGGQ